MTRAILNRSGVTRHGKMVSPSANRDLAARMTSQRITPEQSDHGFPFGWKQIAGTVVGALILKRFPRTVIMGAFTLGVTIGVAMMNKGNRSDGPFKGTGLAKLH